MEDRIRIDTGVKRLLINDGPEFIEFNPEDVAFAERFYQLIKDFEAKSEEYKVRSAAITAEKAKDGNGLPVNLPDALKLLREVCEYMRSEIDGLFGTGTSKKVFGEALYLNMFEQFFTEVTPYIRAARGKKVAKYLRPDKAEGPAVMP